MSIEQTAKVSAEIYLIGEAYAKKQFKKLLRKKLREARKKLSDLQNVCDGLYCEWDIEYKARIELLKELIKEL